MRVAALRALCSRLRSPLEASRSTSQQSFGTSGWLGEIQDAQALTESIEEVRARIFENRIGTGFRSGAKVLRQKLTGEKVKTYYPTPIAKNDPLYVSLSAEAKKGKLEKLKRRGKAPPRKGQGKRTSGKRK